MKIEHKLRRNLEKVLDYQLDTFRVLKTIMEKHHKSNYRTIIMWKTIDGNTGGAEAYWSENEPNEMELIII